MNLASEQSTYSKRFGERRESSDFLDVIRARPRLRITTDRDLNPQLFVNIPLWQGLRRVVRPLCVHFWEQSSQRLFQGLLIKRGDPPDARERSNDLSAIFEGDQRAAGPLETGDRPIRIQRNYQEISPASSITQVPDVPHVQEIKATISEDDSRYFATSSKLLEL